MLSEQVIKLENLVENDILSRDGYFRQYPDADNMSVSNLDMVSVAGPSIMMDRAHSTNVYKPKDKDAK